MIKIAVNLQSLLAASIVLSISLPLSAQRDSIPPGVYHWGSPQTSKQPHVLIEGSTRDLELLQLSARLISSRERIDLQTSASEHLLIVKSGQILISLRDSSFVLNKGSIALIQPSDRYTLQNQTKYDGEFYLMTYNSRNPGKLPTILASSFVKQWDKIPFKPHDKGGIRNYFNLPTSMTKRFEMHVTTLNEGLKSHDPHRHRAAEIILLLDGQGEIQIDDKFYPVSSGDAVYLSSNISHAIRNAGKGACVYFAFQFE